MMDRERTLSQSSGARGRRRRTLVASLLAAALIAIAFACWAEWRHSAQLVAGLPSLDQALRRGGASPEAASLELDALAEVAARVSAAGNSPLGLSAYLGRFGPVAVAQGRYAAAADALLPALLAGALEDALASEGGSAPLYDTLRTLAILRGEAPWQPEFVEGWLADRAAVDPVLGGLAPHVAALSGPPRALDAPDPDLVDPALAIVAEGDPTAMAFLELARDARIRALPAWSPADIPGLTPLLVRRSGRPVESALPGLFTAAGWAAAGAGAAAEAVRRAEVERNRLLGPAAALPATTLPATEQAVLGELQRHTLDAWSAELADLRVRPFTDRSVALLTSRALAQPGSPLEQLFLAALHEAGAGDPTRGRFDQFRIAAALGPTAHFVEEGHMSELTRLFAGLERTVTALDADADLEGRRLMDAPARSAAIAALDQAPRPVAAVVEDVLAETGAGREGLRKPRAALVWQRDLAGACRFALAARYPFVTGPDAGLALVAALIRPDGTLNRFRSAELASLLDTSATPWHWRPEARLAGFDPLSADFLERAAAAGDALFPTGGVDLTLTSLDPRTAATASVGGVTVPLDGAEEPWTLNWPGPQPQAGFGVAIATGTTVERRSWEGPWGLLHFLDETGIRALDGGRDYRLDVRLSRTGAPLALAFASPANPVEARGLIAGLACPQML